ncbi:helix-turn-helix domain-containing protein [Amedibacillus sp. YH-ame10]
MDVCYNKLFKLLIDKGLKKTVFAKEVGISQNTLAKLSKNEYVSMEVLVKVCRGLECTPNDILDILPEGEEKEGDVNGK